MIENGLHQFYHKFTNFLLQIRGIKGAHTVDAVEHEVLSVSLENFHFPLLMYASLMAVTVIVFAVETTYKSTERPRYFKE